MKNKIIPFFLKKQLTSWNTNSNINKGRVCASFEVKQLYQNLAACRKENFMNRQ